MPSRRHIPGNAPYLSGELLLVEVPKMKHDSGLPYDAVRKMHESDFGLGCAVCSGGAIGVPSLALVPAQVAGVGSGGISGGSDSLGKLNSRSAWGRVMPWASTMCVTTLVRQLQCLPHTGQSAGRRIVAGWVQWEEAAFPCEVLCVPAVRHPSRTNSMCVGWRAAVVVAAIRICAKLRCGGGPVRPLPHE
ncbi:hypothetical protein TcCL_NonESM12997 [Trypanosoma cruzi]|nr:hypothetical protein TcCL_NonESM12997 [Trypanosoma cruzi]